jgi:mRNA interferase MazF
MTKQMTKTIRRGEVWLVNLGAGSGSIQGGNRPCIIISNDMANTHSPVINIIPITSRTKNKLPTHVEISFECGVIKDSIALVEQITLINKDALVTKLGNVNTATLDKLEIATFIQLGVMDKIKHLLRNRVAVTA